EVRFGAIVNFCRMKDRKNTVSGRFQLVGVDEADIKQHKIAFVAPIARALTGKKKGEEVKAFIAGEEQLLKILDIEY
ncbi:MAG: GreA/GreB family elongation factor, partial [Gillisia sp.]